SRRTTPAPTSTPTWIFPPTSAVPCRAHSARGKVWTPNVWRTWVRPASRPAGDVPAVVIPGSGAPPPVARRPAAVGNVARSAPAPASGPGAGCKATRADPGDDCSRVGVDEGSHRVGHELSGDRGEQQPRESGNQGGAAIT